MARYEDFSCGLLRIGAGRGIPAVGAGQSSVVSATLTPAAVGISATADQVGFAVPGVEATDIVTCVRYPTQAATWITKCTPTAKDTLTITFSANAAGGTPTSGTYTFLVLKTQ
jgi:hypothetical protein